ncbi:MAG: O-antigen ligase family protein [bacterium]
MSEARLPPFRWVSKRHELGLLALGVLLSFVAGFSIFIFGSPVSSLAVGGGVAALGFTALLFRKPVWAVYGAVLVVFLPQGLIPSGFHSLLNRAMLLLALGLWLLDVAIHERRMVWLGPALLLLLFVIWSTITLLWASDLTQGLDRIAQYASRLILFLVVVVNQIDSTDKLDGLMDVMAIIGWLLVVLGLEQLGFRGYGARLQVLDENINAYGISLLVMMPGVLWRAVKSPDSPGVGRAVLGFLYVALALVLIALTASRGSVLSLGIALVLFSVWRPTRPWAAVALILAFIGIAVAPSAFSALVERSAEEGALGGRLPIWEASWMLIRDHPWRGVGIGNADEAVMPYLRMLTRTWGRTERAIHNPVLQIWAETGVPGVLLYLGMLANTFFLFGRRYLRSRNQGERSLFPYFALVSCVSIGYLFSWIKGGGMEHHPSVFLLLSLLLIPSRIRSEEDRADGEVPLLRRLVGGRTDE